MYDIAPIGGTPWYYAFLPYLIMALIILVPYITGIVIVAKKLKEEIIRHNRRIDDENRTKTDYEVFKDKFENGDL